MSEIKVGEITITVYANIDSVTRITEQEFRIAFANELQKVFDEWIKKEIKRESDGDATIKPAGILHDVYP